MFSHLAAALGSALLLALFAGSSAHGADASVPDYVAIVRHVEVNRPPAEVWKRVGGYCAISEWLKVTCKYTSGSGDVGSVRLLNGTTVEVMVAKTAYSYTYWQTSGNMAPTSYHGTVAVESDGPGKSRITYTLFYNQAALASDAQRASEHERLGNRFQTALDTMKTLAESGQ